MRVVIVGNGVAGISVAMELRSREPDPAQLDITMVSDEAYHNYARIKIPELFVVAAPASGPAGDREPDSLTLKKPLWYHQRHIALCLGQSVVGLDRNERLIYLSSGTELRYDRLVLALGSDPVRPSLTGAFLPGVFTLREYDDAVRIRSWIAARPGPAVVLGGGLLGLEAARHLAEAGLQDVTVVEAAPRLLPRQLDEGCASILASTLAGMGLRIVTAAKAASFAGADRVEALALEDGRRLGTSTVILSLGVRPRTGLAKAAGLATSKGILVDSFLRSSDSSIYAVGDCAEAGGSCLGIIPAALEQAACCAAALLGDESRPYAGTVPSNTLKVAGIDLSSAGAVELPADAEELRFEPGPGRYERYILADGKLAGAIVLGDKERARAALRLTGKIATRADIEGLPSSGKR